MIKMIKFFTLKINRDKNGKTDEKHLAVLG